ncbi:unnamed protein product [Vitrella brassicaformis CCMP3155]|uniref:Uncharacterized protein n=2 Tax=Vitrella brassicaformis TaxID=1169539 RepID=A0A0G4FIY4_VITBC|nr:unnamed protein product [Vitrella brassicaformis CCMP3155]|eukprot:CEM13722.1 unnamed protein product [Vitrella brassicaformis CCMP3155]
MRLFFGAKKEENKAPAVDLPTAIKSNKEAIATLEKRQQHLEKRIQAQEDEARAKTRAKDKRGALLALKRKKLFNQELDQLNNARLTLEQQIMTLESAQTQTVAVEALQTGVNAQKIMNQRLNIDKIDNLMEDMQEQQDLQNEVAQVLSSGQPIMDDDELLNELQELEAEELDNKLLSAGTVPTGLPAVPAGAEAAGVSAEAAPSAPAPVKTQQQAAKPLSDEDQLAALQAELA